MAIDYQNGLWRKIITGSMDPPVKSLPLKIKINFLRMQFKSKKISEDTATNELIDFCKQNEKVLEMDLGLIVKSNIFQR
jgi:hypothetical protein